MFFPFIYALILLICTQSVCAQQTGGAPTTPQSSAVNNYSEDAHEATTQQPQDEDSQHNPDPSENPLEPADPEPTQTTLPHANSQELVEPTAVTKEKFLHIRALDKVTARVETIKIRLGEMAAFGRLRIAPTFCQKSKPTDPPETTAFLRIYEVLPNQKEMKILFSGWMFASSPTVSSLNHPVYDIWVKTCTSKKDKPMKVAPINTETPEQKYIQDHEKLTPEE